MAYEATILGRIPNGTLVTGQTLHESSGGVDSRLHAGVWWTHSDSGGVYVYALDYDGTFRKAIRLTGVDMGAGQWEDCAYDDFAGNSMWVANCGGNTPVNSFKAFYFDEPSNISDPSTVTNVAATTYWFKYPGSEAYDCETMLCDPTTGRVYFVTKEAIGTAQLYQAPASLVARTAGGSQVNTLTAVTSGNWTKAGNLTGGDIDRTGEYMYIGNNNSRGFKYNWSTKAFIEEFYMPRPKNLSGAEVTAETLFVSRNRDFLIRSSEGANIGGQQIIRLELAAGGGPPPPPPTYTYKFGSAQQMTLRWQSLGGGLTVPGGDFEQTTDPALWTTTGSGSNTIARSSTVTAAAGSYFGLLTVNSATGNHNLDSNPIAVTEGATLPDISASARWITGATPRNVRLDLRFFSDAGGTTSVATGGTSTGTSTATSGASWTVLTRSGVVVPATAVSMRVRLVTLSASPGEAVAFDAVG